MLSVPLLNEHHILQPDILLFCFFSSFNSDIHQLHLKFANDPQIFVFIVNLIVFLFVYNVLVRFDGYIACQIVNTDNSRAMPKPVTLAKGRD